MSLGSGQEAQLDAHDGGFARDILQPSENLYTLKRPVSDAVRPLREQLSHVDDFVATAVLDTSAPDVSKLQLRRCGLPEGPALDALEADVRTLVRYVTESSPEAACMTGDKWSPPSPQRKRALDISPGLAVRALTSHGLGYASRDFGALSGAAHAPTTLTLTRQDMCTRLHVDAVRLRLLMTYFGPGTEWVASTLASRVVSEAIRDGGNPLGDALKAVVERAAPIERAEEGEVVVLKGQFFEGARGRAIVHRSPLVEADGAQQPRLLLKIDDSASPTCGADCCTDE